MILSRILPLLASAKIQYCIVGGYAVALHGVARGTLDLDIITELTESNLIKVEELLLTIGMKSSLPIDARMIVANRENYIKDKNLIAWNFIHAERKMDILDILITEDVRNYKTVVVSSQWGDIPVIDFDGLIQLKSKTRRSQDIEDVNALKSIQGKRKS
ncbi:hypothetical protein [Leptospira sp. GIMC2001]|uniref:hypothetical protein n=1 Tax=Leptospira sp. GIMC2001 TaxID=1513297 RepID=UPI00234A6FAC|nr:hypothetical protein [Leptospira sp. GIMC2001]WCL49213.1 hypothetical protein O4O04_18255 [Leptospira sp. GIMC2001]